MVTAYDNMSSGSNVGGGTSSYYADPSIGPATGQESANATNRYNQIYQNVIPGMSP